MSLDLSPDAETIVREYAEREGVSIDTFMPPMPTTDAPNRRRKKQPVRFQSRFQAWATPPAFFATIDREFGFTLDVCALPDNAKCPRFYSPAEDGLKQAWEGVCWCNPSYGKEIAQWVSKARDSAASGAATVVCLVPARTDTRWWHELVLPHAAEVRYVRGRLRFGDAVSSASFPSALVIYRPAAPVAQP